LYYSLANRTALQEDTELEEYIVQMTNAPEIITKCSMHEELGVQPSPFHQACKMENLNLLQMFLSYLPHPPQPDDGLLETVRISIMTRFRFLMVMFVA